MREIKFKFWSKTENKFLDDYYICIRMGLPYELEVGQTVYDEGFSYNTLEFPTDDIGCEVSSSDVVVLQYTGLKDKNGKEILNDSLVVISEGGLKIKLLEDGRDFELKSFNISDFFVYLESPEYEYAFSPDFKAWIIEKGVFNECIDGVDVFPFLNIFSSKINLKYCHRSKASPPQTIIRLRSPKRKMMG